MKPTESNGHTEHRAAGYGHVLKYTGLFGGVQGFFILMGIVRNKFAAVLLGPTGMGQIDFYSRSADFVGNTTNLGIGFSAIRRLSELYEEGNHAAAERYVRLVRTWSLMAALLGTLCCLASSPWLSLMATRTTAYTAEFCLLSVMVGTSTLMAGELAILKGCRCLKQIAANSVFGALGTLLITVPLYVFLGNAGIVPGLVGSTALVLLLHLHAATRLFPWRVDFSPRFLRCGIPLLQMGLAYVGAGILGTGAEMLVRLFLVSTASWAEAGFYAAGLTLTVSYARLVFMAMEADYFPRLSATRGDTVRMNLTVNRQIDVLVLLMAPFLIVFSLMLPLVVRILYTADFLRVVPMVLAATFYMYFKAVYAPASYLSLARGDSRVYLVMELIYDVAFAAFVAAGYHWGGLPGAGAALSAANLLDLVLITTVYRRRYGFRFAPDTLRRVFLQFLLLLGGVGAACLQGAALRYSLGGMALALSAGFSWHLLRQELGKDWWRKALRRK